MSFNPKNILSNPHVSAILRPFHSDSSPHVSPENNIVNAHIYDWDNHVSKNNHISGAQLDFRPSNLREHEE